MKITDIHDNSATIANIPHCWFFDLSLYNRIHPSINATNTPII